jgi:flagellar hook-associated protein 2
VYIDGLRVTSASNSVTNAIDGVTLDLLDAQAAEDFSDGDTINLTIANDEDSVKGAINNFIEVYNGFIGVVDQLTLVVVNDGTTGNLTGALTGDSTVRNLVSNIRSSLSEGIDTNPDGLQFLVNLGLTTDEEGLLTLDESALDEALDNDIEAVANLFIGDAGLSERLSAALDGYTGSDGVLELRQDSLRETINDIDDQREALEARLELTEARLFSQYQAADALIGQLNNTLGFITSALSSIDFNNDDN